MVRYLMLLHRHTVRRPRTAGCTSCWSSIPAEANTATASSTSPPAASEASPTADAGVAPRPMEQPSTSASADSPTATTSSVPREVCPPSETALHHRNPLA
jgi:hypothetical protein